MFRCLVIFTWLLIPKEAAFLTSSRRVNYVIEDWPVLDFALMVLLSKPLRGKRLYPCQCKCGPWYLSVLLTCELVRSAESQNLHPNEIPRWLENHGLRSTELGLSLGRTFKSSENLKQQH